MDSTRIEKGAGRQAGGCFGFLGIVHILAFEGAALSVPLAYDMVCLGCKPNYGRFMLEGFILDYVFLEVFVD